ncbi:hypothetical protein [Flammeovirga sp. EKP202]|uniref:hypothetical protein n=1 Tax=Flammeovirga sp. EKP202 TaxID=2770592 RepID=UPI00165FEF8E|nr:hypothetical protein [Flammeovirga sp. EKP202]MBD0403646.1 hypothetical protein [Flammeovirga sp. EKP202]
MKTYTNFILLLFLFSCGNHEQELQSYKKEVAELNATHLALESQVKEQEIQINTLKGVTEKWDVGAMRNTYDSLNRVYRSYKKEINKLSNKEEVDPEGFKTLLEFNLPGKLFKSFQSLSDTYRISPAVNPFYVRGHFNEDEMEDYALFIENIENKKLGLAIFMGGDFEKHYVLGAGNKDNFGQDNMYGTLAVSVVNKGDVWIREGEPEPVIKSPQVIYVSFSNLSSAVAYLEDGEFKFYGQAD